MKLQANSYTVVLIDVDEVPSHGYSPFLLSLNFPALRHALSFLTGGWDYM